MSADSETKGAGELLIHRLHYGTDDPGKDCTTARAPKRISEETAKGPSGSRIGTSSTPKEAAKKGSSSHTADRTADDLGQLTHRHLLQDRAYRLAAENARNDLNYNRKYRFHFDPPLNARTYSWWRWIYRARLTRFGQAE